MLSRTVSEVSAATSSGLCQHEAWVHSLVDILIHEHGIEYPLDTRSVAEDAHGSCSPAYLPEPPLNGIGGSYRLPEVRVVELEAGEQLFKIVRKAPDGLRVLFDP